MSRQFLTLCAAVSATAGLFGAVDGLAQAQIDPDTAAFTRRAADAHASLMRGDIAGYRRSIAIADDFTLMDPFGGRPTGAPGSEAHWQRIGRFFRDGRDATFELLRAYRSPELVVLVANERAHVAVGSLPAQPWSLRVTLVFRRDGGAWRLVHRHADPLAEGITLRQAARITLGRGAGAAGA